MEVVFNLLKVLALLPVFLLLSIFVFYLPGYLLISQARLKLRDDEQITLSIGTGLVLFLIIAIFTALIGARILSPLILLSIILYAFYRYRTEILAPFLGLIKQKILMALLLFGTFVEGFINFPSGFPYQQGHIYWSSQGHDGLWHIAVIEAIKKSLPPFNPLYAGEKLYNYHYFSDIIMAEFNKIFPFFSSLDLYFRYFAFLISFLIGLAAYSFLTTWKKNKSIGLLGIFFSYFVGSFGYIVLAVQHRGFFGGETIFWAAQGNTIIGNPTHAFCYLLLPTFFLAFYHYLNHKNRLPFLICFLLGAFLIGFKVSAGFVLVAGLTITSFVSLITKKQKDIAFLTSLIGLFNFGIFKTITRSGESFLIFQPWWFIRTMIIVPDRVNWFDLELRRQFYLAKGGFRAILRIVEFETIAFFLFLVGNLGTRIIGFWEIGKSLLRKTIFKEPLETTLFFAMLTSFLIPLFFVQKGVAYNLIQFMQYFLLIFSFFAAISLYHFLNLFKSKMVKVLILVIFFAFSIPTVVGNLLDFYGKNPLVIISNQELKALNFLKNKAEKDDIILTKSFNPYASGLYKHQPWPIYAWESTGYVSAYTSQQTYCTDEGQLRILAINPEGRIKKANTLFDLKPLYDQNGNFLHYAPTEDISLKQKGEFLEEEKIDFVYLRQEETDEVQKEIFTQLGLKEIFENNEIIIYEVD